MSYTIRNVSIDSIVPGDVIIHEGVMKTISKSSIGKDSLLGKTLFGDSYNSGYKPVKLVVFNKPQ